MGVKILSLFDGMACGMIAMQLAGVDVESYDAYEIDKYAIKTAQHNFPMIKEHGDVFDADFTQYEGVDFLIGGSPCTFWSIAQTKNRETVASGMGWELFSQYVRALHEAKPKYFIYENNKSMSKQIRASIDEAFGFEAVLINSALVSAQNRQRLYWVGKRNADGTYSKVDVEQPADRGILLKDVLDNAVAMREKAHTIDANYYKGGNFTSPNKQSGKRLMVAEPVSYCTGKNMEHLMRNFGSKGKIVDEESKTPTLMAAAGMGGGNHIYYANSIAEPINVTADDKSHTLKAQYYKNGIANFVSNDGFDATAVAEPVCLRYERTEEAKRCRKAYEAHEIKHGYNELNELHPRPDGKTNTLTTVLKDNQIMVPVCVAERGRMYRGQPQHYEARTDGKTNTLTSVEKDNRVAEPINVESYEISHTCDFNVTPSGTLRVAYTDKSESQGYRVYCADYKSVAMRAQGNGRGAEPVAEPINDILQVGAMPRPDGEISTSAGFRIYSTEAKGRYLCANGGGAGAKTGLYAMPLDGFIPGERTVGSQMEFLGGISGCHEKWLEDGKNYSRNFSQGHRLYGVNGKAVTQTAQACGYAGNTGLYAIPTMPVKEATAKGYTEIECGDCVDLSMPNSKTRRGRNMADKANCMQTSNDFYQYVGYAIEFDDDGKPIKAIGKDGKEITIYEVKDGKITIKGKQYPIKLKDGYYIIRKLTVSECKRLQTVPEWYEFPVSNSQAYKMLGNGWTCEVIAHLIRACVGGE